MRSIYKPHFFTFLGLAGIVTVLGACDVIQTAPERGGERIAVLPVPASRATDGTASVLLVTEFVGIESDSESDKVLCRWRVVNQDTHTSYFINFKTGETNTVVQLDPGAYKTGRLGCGINKVWDLDDVFKEGFHVDNGHISYLGKLVFEFQDGELVRLRKAPRAESAQAFLAALEKTSPAERKSFISGFTEKPLESAMISGSDLGQDGFDVHAKGVENPGKALGPLLSNLQLCSNSEASTDPIRFGRLQYTAVYKDGRFSEMKDRQENNAFSDHLRSCVERGIMAFHPELKKDVEVRVRY